MNTMMMIVVSRSPSASDTGLVVVAIIHRATAIRKPNENMGANVPGCYRAGDPRQNPISEYHPNGPAAITINPIIAPKIQMNTSASQI